VKDGVQVRQVLVWKNVKKMENDLKYSKNLKSDADSIKLEIYDPVNKKWYPAEKKGNGYEMTEKGKSMWRSDMGQMSSSTSTGH